jgi:hypothetical protein
MTALTQPQMDNLRRPGTCPRARVAPELAEGLAEEGVRSGLRRQPWRAHDMQATRHAPRATLQAPVAPQHPSLPDPPRAHAQGALQTLGARAAKLRLADGVARTVAERAMTRPLKADAPTAAATLAGCSGLQTALTPAPAPTERVQDRDQARAAVAQACRAGTTVPLAGRPLC